MAVFAIFGKAKRNGAAADGQEPNPYCSSSFFEWNCRDHLLLHDSDFTSILHQLRRHCLTRSEWIALLTMLAIMRQGLCDDAVSVCLSVLSCTARCAVGLLLWAPRVVDIDQLLHGARICSRRGHSSTAVSSKCEQCHVYSDVGTDRRLVQFFLKTHPHKA